MDIHSARQQLRQKSIYEIPLRVTFYARVSSESDEQLNSLSNQVAYYEDFIRKNPTWDYIPGYTDEGLSGISTRKRENFHRMVQDAEAGAFDLIVTKEISRFARNTLDSIFFTRQLLAAGVAVFFQNDNINTLDEDAELRLAIMSSIAQDELRKLSSRVRFGHQQAIREGVVLGNSRIFGYCKDHGRLVIDEAEAEMVRSLFQLYASGNYSMKQLEQLFWDKGYRNTRGNKLSHTTMANIIANPKYKGYYAGNKVKVIDMFTKKQKFLPPEEWVVFKDETGETVPALVYEALWDEANDILQRRSSDVRQRQNQCNHPNLLTGKLYCGCCGAPYYRRDAKDRHGRSNSKWVCSGKLKNGAAACPAVPLYEQELKAVLADVFRDTRPAAGALAARYTQMYQTLTAAPDSQMEAAKLQSAIDHVNRKKRKLLLDGAQLQAVGQAFNGQDILPIGQARQEQAGIRRHAVHQDGASAAFADLAAALGARQAQAVAQHRHQGLAFFDFDLDRFMIDGTRNLDHFASPFAAAYAPIKARVDRARIKPIRNSLEARQDVRGFVACRTRSATSSIIASVGTLPARNASASGQRSGVGPATPKAMLAAATVPSAFSWQVAAAPKVEISIALRTLDLLYMPPQFVVPAWGISMQTSSSPGSFLTRPGPA